MSKLKAHSIIGLDGRCNRVDNDYYLKSEADKVIADLEERHKMEVGQLLIEIVELKKQVHDYAQGLYVMQARSEKEARHHKYKRCLDNASKYLWKRNYWRDSTPAYERQHQWENMAYKHYKRWMELANKFKEAK